MVCPHVSAKASFPLGMLLSAAHTKRVRLSPFHRKVMAGMKEKRAKDGVKGTGLSYADNEVILR